MRAVRFGGVWLGIAAMLVVGCGQRGPAGPKKLPVSGSITFNGKPVDGATVTFVSADQKTAAVGRTDASGRYELVGGALPGTYKVKVEKFEQAAPPPSGGGPVDIAEDKSYKPPPEGAPPEAPPKSLLPPKYADPNQSGLTATVDEKGKNRFDFDLK